jgi:hypothetical protein
VKTRSSVRLETVHASLIWRSGLKAIKRSSCKGATLASEGSDANVVTLSYGDRSIGDFVAIETIFSALGDLSAGIVMNAATTGSTRNVFLGSVLVETADGPAILVDGVGPQDGLGLRSTANMTIANSTLATNVSGLASLGITTPNTLLPGAARRRRPARFRT